MVVLKFLGDFSFYAVCVPVYKGNLIFEVRSENIPQPLEVSFPGGKIEEGEEPYDAAVRELNEETGLNVVRKLFDVEPLITPFNTVIFPFVVLVDISEMKVNSNEVKDVFMVPIEFFKTPYKIGYVDVRLKPRDDFPYELIPFGENYNWKKGFYKVLFYKYDKYVIWGLTARIAQRVYEIFSGGKE